MEIGKTLHIFQDVHQHLMEVMSNWLSCYSTDVGRAHVTSAFVHTPVTVLGTGHGI